MGMFDLVPIIYLPFIFSLVVVVAAVVVLPYIVKNVNSIMLLGVLKMLTKRQEVVFIFSSLPQLSGMLH